MRTAAGQAARVLHRLAHFLLGSVVVACLGFGILTWRLAQGPLDIAFIAYQIQDSLNDDLAKSGSATRIHIGRASIVWEGWSGGVDRPLDVVLRDVDAVDGGNTPVMSVPFAEVSLSLFQLLQLRLRPRAISLDGVALRLERDTDGSLAIDLGGAEPDNPDQAGGKPAAASPATALVTELMRPPQHNGDDPRVSRLSQLRRLRITNASVIVVDRGLGATWRAPQGEINLTRGLDGGVAGYAALDLALGDQRTKLVATAALNPADALMHVSVKMDPVDPARLATVLRTGSPLRPPLSVLSAPLTLSGELALTPTLQLQQITMEASFGAGRAAVNGASIPLLGGALKVEADRTHAARGQLSIRIDGRDGHPPTVISASADGTWTPDAWLATLTVGLDQVAFADLPGLWPVGIGGPGLRPWITQNITTGVAHDAQFKIGLKVKPDFSDADLTSATGRLEGDALTVFWLRPIPPIEGGHAILNLLDPDTLEIAVTAGHQHVSAGRSGNGLSVADSKLRITGLSGHHQIATINGTIAGQLADVLALLQEKRLHLFDRRPLDLRNPSGQVKGQIAVTVPLENDVKAEQVGVHATMHLDDGALPGVVAGHDLTKGTLDATVDTQGMKITGHADLAGVPSQLGIDMDFRAGPPAQVVERVTVSGTPTTKNLAALGLDSGGAAEGAGAVSAIYTLHRDSLAEVAVKADLRDVALVVPVLKWRKPRGTPATVDALLHLDHDRLADIDHITAAGEGIAVHASGALPANAAAFLNLDQLRLGGTDVRGALHWPKGIDGPMSVTLSGHRLDLSGRYLEKDAEQSAKPMDQPLREKPAPRPWTADIRLDEIVLARGRTIAGFILRGDYDGRDFRTLLLEGRTAPAAPFHVDIRPAVGGRALSARVSNLGDLLRAANFYDDLSDGALTVMGDYEDGAPGRPLVAVAELGPFRIRNAPVIGRILQAMTLYGLAEVMRGPGLGFTKAEVPFRLTGGDTLDLGESRAFSASLGLTAKGRILLDGSSADLTGTVVPAYFFNSLLGDVPLVGRLFSPEQGGGVFAATYTVTGPLDDPKVGVNPLSALTPGFLRGLFKLF
jgi:hypothetical protein